MPIEIAAGVEIAEEWSLYTAVDKNGLLLAPVAACYRGKLMTNVFWPDDSTVTIIGLWHEKEWRRQALVWWQEGKLQMADDDTWIDIPISDREPMLPINKELCRRKPDEPQIDWEAVSKVAEAGEEIRVLVWDFENTKKTKNFFVRGNESPFFTSALHPWNRDEGSGAFWKHCELVRAEDIERFSK